MTPDSTADPARPADLAALAAAIARRPLRRSRLSRQGRVEAAVCVPLQAGRHGPEVWAIKRTEGLRHHAREIAFPGGKPDAADRDLADTALREMEEELGVPRASVRLLGALAPVPTATSRFTLNPFVALVDPTAVPRCDPGEVALLIRMPLGDFFEGRVPYRAIDLGLGWRSPIFDFEAGAMYGASAHVMEELLLVYAEVFGLDFPEPVLTDEIPWQ